MGPVDHRRGGGARDPRWRLFTGMAANCQTRPAKQDMAKILILDAMGVLYQAGDDVA